VITEPKEAGSAWSKVFTPRNSELTNLMKIKDIATIYNVFVASLLIVFLSTTVDDILTTGT